MSDVTAVAATMMAGFAVIFFIGAAFVLIGIMDRQNKVFYIGTGLVIVSVMFMICVMIGLMKS